MQWKRSYKPFAAYAQSKLANLLFTFELQRRSDANGWRLMSNAAYPGYARTDPIPNGPGADALLSKISIFLQPFMSHSAAAGALPTLFAATSPEAKNAGYYGPNGCYEMKGPPAPSYVSPKAKDASVPRKLWEVSERLTGVNWPVGEEYLKA